MISSNSVVDTTECPWHLFHNAIYHGQESGKRGSLETQVKLYLSPADGKHAQNPTLYEVRLLWYYMENTK
jgi:hypothetical protein